MPAYTNSDDVKAILGDSVSAEKDLTPWVDLAHVFVLKWCPAYDASSQPDGYAEGELEAIEKLLAAHLYTSSPDSDTLPNKLVRERAGEVEEEYQKRVVVGYGLDTTEWGKMAMLYDWRGHLAALNNKMKTVTQQVPAGKKTLIGGQNIGGGPPQRRPYNDTDARWW